ncbi:MAG: transposase [Burkholderiales bacterium]|nr:transposase [Anaerolineae bacterium]
MVHSIEVRKTYKYRLYRCDKRDQHLHRQINIAGTVFNHALALQKRYYRLTGNYIPLGQLKAHVAKLRRETERYAYWKQLGSQAVQDVLERLDDGYQRFFKQLAKRPPKYKKMRQRQSFTLKQAGYKLLDGNQIKIGRYVYKFVKHREMHGTVKTVTIKRDAAHRLWLLFSVVEEIDMPKQVTTGQIAGFDFGLKTFLTDHNGKQYISGLYHLHALRRLRVIQSRKDKKPHGTNNRKKAAKLIARTHIRVADKRRDAHYKLAHDLCAAFDVLCFEDLKIDGMKRLWGRKVSDLAFTQFMSIVKHVANVRGKEVCVISRWERTTGKCSCCGHVQAMELRERTFHCDSCGLILDRDHNAAINIMRAGASAQTNRETVSRVRETTRSLV